MDLNLPTDEFWRYENLKPDVLESLLSREVGGGKSDILADLLKSEEAIRHVNGSGKLNTPQDFIIFYAFVDNALRVYEEQGIIEFKNGAYSVKK